MRRGAIEWTFIGWNEMRALTSYLQDDEHLRSSF
jgi:hypothetical protein